MRRLLLAVAALALVPATTSYAGSEPLPVVSTGCDYTVAVQDPNDATRLTGVLYGSVVVADLPSRDGAGGNPSTVTLTCSIQSASYRHYDPDDFTATGSGVNGAVVAPAAFSVPAPADGPLGVCERVDVTDANGTHTYWRHSQNGTWAQSDFWPTCSGAPQCLALGSNCNGFLALVEWAAQYGVDLSGVADGTLCPYLAAQSPGVPGVVDVTADGDVYIAGEWVWDCPPYGS